MKTPSDRLTRYWLQQLMHTLARAAADIGTQHPEHLAGFLESFRNEVAAVVAGEKTGEWKAAIHSQFPSDRYFLSRLESAEAKVDGPDSAQ